MIHVSRRLWMSGLAFLAAQAAPLTSIAFARAPRKDEGAESAFSASSHAAPPTPGRGLRHSSDQAFDFGVHINDFGEVADGTRIRCRGTTPRWQAHRWTIRSRT